MFGSLAMLVGAVDPMEGSLLILPGSALVALGAFVGHCERRIIIHRVWVFILIAFGVGAMFAMTAVGGFGGPSGRSMWWGVLVLPYLIGWSLGMWGPGVPRWVALAGIVVGLWYLALPALILAQRHANPARPVFPVVLIALGCIGLLTIAGCIYRVWRQGPAAPPAGPAA